MAKYPRIIVLDGPSSSGKSSICYHLANELELPYLYMLYDYFLDVVPMNYWDRPSIKKALKGPLIDNPYYKFQVLRHQFIKSALDAGYSVIVDHIMVHKSWHDEFQKLFAKYDPFYVKITCSVEELTRREHNRGNRRIGLAAEQAKLTYKLWTKYHMEVDTTHTPSDAAALKIIKFIENKE